MDTVRSATPNRGGFRFHDIRFDAMIVPNLGNRIQFADLGREPFRIFFPAAVLAGIIGVALWPFYFAHLASNYPGLAHPRIMSCGFFGGFIFGFLGTAMPRMLSANPFRLAE